MDRRSFLFKIPAAGVLLGMPVLPQMQVAPQGTGKTVVVEVLGCYQSGAPFRAQARVRYKQVGPTVYVDERDRVAMKFDNESGEDLRIDEIRSGLPEEWISSFRTILGYEKTYTSSYAGLPVTLTSGNTLTVMMDRVLASLSL